ncbi:MAG: Gfo/Idh/MocA family oxidoreductase [Eubacteriales bacterium]
MKKFRVGLIGCGGRQQVHIDALLKMEDVEIVAVADPVEDRRLRAAAKTGATGVYKDHTELFDSVAEHPLDALFIAVEPTAHHRIEERAIELGIPFMVEKPMTLDLAQAEQIAAMIKAKKLITSVGFQDRYLDLMETVKAELPKHPTGGLVYGAWIGNIPGVWWWQKKSTCGGQLLEQNIHLVDGLRFLFGEPLSVYAIATRGMVTPGVDASPEYDTDDHSVCLFRFPNQITAALASGCYVTEVRPNCGLLISLKDIVIDYRLRNNLILTSRHQTVDIKPRNNQSYDLDRNFLDAVRTGNATLVRSPYDDALKTLKVCFAANRSMETGEVIYFGEEKA